jgi:hypothetical protein
MPDPITAPCRRDYKAVHSSGARNASAIQFEIVHCGESPSARGIASWFANPQSGGSTQRAIDDDAGYRTLDDLEIPWGAPPLNQTGLHLELAGYSRWKPTDWLKHRRMLQRVAYKIAGDCAKYSIPIRWLGKNQLLALGKKPGHGKGGITDHVSISYAWGETNHTDPGPGFATASGTPSNKAPRALLLWYVRKYYREITEGAPSSPEGPEEAPSSPEGTPWIPPNQDRPK